VSASTTAVRVPGWERVLNAFMAAPDRTLTNVQLGDVPGVQAFHQRIQDMRRYGYVVTEAVLVKKGRYAYTLVGVRGDEGVSDLRHADALPHLHDEAIDAAIRDAEGAIEANREALAKRERAPIRPPARTVEQSRMVRDAVASLQDGLPEGVLADLGDGRDDLLSLAHAARDAMTVYSSSVAAEVISAHRTALVAVLNVLGDPPPIESADILVAWAQERRDSIVAAEIAADRAERRPAARAPRADRAPTGPTLMRKALEHHEQPMHSAKIAAWVMENGGADVYKGKTPAATMAAQLATSNKEEAEFVKVAPGCYALREWTGKHDQFGDPLLDLDPIR